MTIPGNKDFLEVLRQLNKDSINNDQDSSYISIELQKQKALFLLICL